MMCVECVRIDRRDGSFYRQEAIAVHNGNSLCADHLGSFRSEREVQAEVISWLEAHDGKSYDTQRLYEMARAHFAVSESQVHSTGEPKQ